MIDVLVFLFQNYYDIHAHPGQDALAKKLSAAGFDPLEISEALEWLHELKSARPAEFAQESPRSCRLYTDEEISRLGTDCIDFVLFLESAGIVSPPVRELILERAMALADDPVPLEKLKVIALMVLWSQAQNLEPLIVEELLATPEDVLLH